MNRFQKGHYIIFIFKKLHLSILAFIILLFIFLYGFQDISDRTSQSQKDSLQSAIERDIAHCYALEGTYPPSLEYLKEHYGLIYDEDRFFVDYQSIGSNIMPDITIIEK